MGLVGGMYQLLDVPADGAEVNEDDVADILEFLDEPTSLGCIQYVPSTCSTGRA